MNLKKHHNFYGEIKNKLGIRSIIIPSTDMKHNYIDKKNHHILKKVLIGRKLANNCKNDDGE